MLAAFAGEDGTALTSGVKRDKLLTGSERAAVLLFPCARYPIRRKRLSRDELRLLLRKRPSGARNVRQSHSRCRKDADLSVTTRPFHVRMTQSNTRAARPRLLHQDPARDSIENRSHSDSFDPAESSDAIAANGPITPNVATCTSGRSAMTPAGRPTRPFRHFTPQRATSDPPRCVPPTLKKQRGHAGERRRTLDADHIRLFTTKRAVHRAAPVTCGENTYARENSSSAASGATSLLSPHVSRAMPRRVRRLEALGERSKLTT